jgi:CheY-like chemotaxis protein
MASQSRSLRLLVVEDHIDTVELLASLLEMRGHIVKTARSVGDALALASAETFDMVLSDVGLPDASGYDLMKRLRETTTMKGIAMSGWGRAEDIARSHEAGFTEHLTKPVQLATLETAIERVIAGA